MPRKQLQKLCCDGCAGAKAFGNKAMVAVHFHQLGMGISLFGTARIINFDQNVLQAVHNKHRPRIGAYLFIRIKRARIQRVLLLKCTEIA